MITKKFNSISALTDWINNTPVNGYFKGHSLETSKENGKKWFGSKSYKEADKLLKYGWAEGAARVKTIMEARNFIGMGTRRKMYNSVVGYVPNVPNYLRGIPMNMINSRKVRAPQKVATIVYNCAVSSDVPASSIEVNAAKLFNVISGLESSGVRVELWIMNAVKSRDNTENWGCAVRVKTAGQPLNVLKSIYPLVHPSFLRRHMLAAMERGNLTRGEWSGYGRPENADRAGVYCAALRLPTDNVFSYSTLRDKTESEVLKMIK